MRAPAVILNPRANGGAAERRWREFLSSDIAEVLSLGQASVFTGEGVEGATVQERITAWVRGQYALGRRAFVAAGGDGTVNAVVNALARLDASDVSLGAIGLGSSNDFHKPRDQRGRAVFGGMPCRLAFDQAFAHDLGEVRVPGETSSYFIINASVGVTAEANAFFNEAGGWFRAVKRGSVGVAILCAALRELAVYRPFELELELVDGETVSRKQARVTNLGVVKNPNFSGSFRYDVAQKADDGRFGVHLLEGLSRPAMLRALSALGRGRFQGLKGASSAQATRVELRAPGVFPLETDGEVRHVRQATIELLPRRLQVCP